MAEDTINLPVTGLTGFARASDAAEKLNTVLSDTQKAMKDLQGKTTESAEGQKKSSDKLKEAIIKQAKSLEEQAARGGDNAFQLEILADRTKQAARMLADFGDETDAGEWSRLNINLTSLNAAVKELDILQEKKGGFELEGSAFEDWLNKPNMGLDGKSLTTMERWQAYNTKITAESMEKFSPIDTLKGGLGILSPELVSISEWIGSTFGNNLIIKSMGFWAKRQLMDWRIRTKEKRLKKAQELWYNRSNVYGDDTEKFQSDLLEQNTSIVDRMKGIGISLKGKVFGKEWADEQRKLEAEKISGVGLEDKEWKEFTESISSRAMEADIDEKGKAIGDLSIGFATRDEKIIGGLSEIENRQAETADIQKPILGVLQDTLAEQETQKKVIESSNKNLIKMQEFLHEEQTKWKNDYLGQIDNELIGAIKEEVNILSEMVKNEETKGEKIVQAIDKSRQDLLDTVYEGYRDDVFTKDALKKEQSDRDALYNALESVDENLHGSPPYLQTLVEFFTGGKFEKAIASPAGTSAGGEAVGVPSQIKQNLKGVGSGILDGIRSFLDGLNAMVKSAFEFFHTFIDGIGRIVQKVADIISKTFINLMKGLGQGIRALFTALGSIPLPFLIIGAAALGAVAVSLMAMGLAMKLAAPFVTAVLGGIAKILTSISKVVKVVAGAIVKLLTSIVDNIIKLTEVPLMDFLKLGVGFAALGAGLWFFGTTAWIAIPSLLALGVASIGLSKLFTALPPDQMSLMASGFRELAGAVRDFGLSSLFLGPAVGLLTALSAIPFANKLLDLALVRGQVSSNVTPEVFSAEKLVVGSVRGTASKALLEGSDWANLNQIEKDYKEKEKRGDNNITSVISNQQETTNLVRKSAQDSSLQNSINLTN